MTDAADFFKFPKRAYTLLMVVLLPLASPSLPGNTTLVDFVNIFFIVFFFILFVIKKKRFKLFLLVPFTVILLGCLIAMFNSQAISTSIFAITQDLYLYLFLLLLYNLIENKEDVTFLVALWLGVGVVESILAILNVVASFSIGASAVSATEDFSRARGTFGNSDALASYLGLSFFLIYQPYFKLHTFWRVMFGLLIFIGMFFTKSMSALLAFTLGNLIIITLYWLRIQGIKKVKLTVATLLAILVITLFFVPKLMEAENFFDRMPRSAGTRMEIWTAGYESLMQHPLGIGPGAFKKVGYGPFNREGKRSELHSDYISHLVERGPLGIIGLFMLYGTFGWVLLNGLKSARSDQEYLWFLGLSGMWCFILVDALNHEGMHYRHVWLAFSLIAVQKTLLESEKM
jgi:O-antigen ligase